MNEGYFEGILQLRNPNKKLIDYVKSQVKKKPPVRIAKEKKVRNGIDLYMSSQKFMFQLGRRLKKSFEGEYKSSRKIFTRKRQTSKQVYRVNILFRLPNFRKGQTLIIEDEPVKILKIGTKVTVQNQKTGKKETHLFEKIDRIASSKH